MNLKTAITRIIIGVVMFAIAGGFIESLVSPHPRGNQPTLAAGTEEPGIHRVLVAYPAQWPMWNYRKCALTSLGLDADHPLMLNCDRESHETPLSREFLIDVEFSIAPTPPTDWTCQQRDTLVCKR
jgi:hypothetical protein